MLFTLLIGMAVNLLAEDALVVPRLSLSRG